MDAAALAAHSRFFDHLVDLVPAKYYLDGGSEQVNLKYMKKSARDEARAAFKQQAKAAKRAKLDPEQAKGTLALQKEAAAAQAAQQNGAVGSGSEDDDEEGSEGSSSGDDSDAEQSRKQRRLAGAADGVQQQRQRQGAVGQLAIPNGKPPSREELKERLQKKLEDLRKARKAEEQQQKAEDAKQWRERSLQEGRKKVGKAAAAQQQQRHKGGKAAPVPPGDAAAAGGQQQQQQGGKGGGKGGKRQREEDSLAFNKLDFGSDPRQQKKQRRKASKAQLLETATAKVAAAAELAGSAEGKAQLAKEAWGTALQRAKGDKVFDDPRLLKKSMKKESKLKAKKSQVWQERLAHQGEQQQAKQQKRKDNIDSRIKAKSDKKKQKRENKLLRAGFEGRKQGFIATPKRAA